VAGLCAFATAVADAEVEGIAEFHTLLRLVVLDRHIRAVLVPGVLLQPVKYDFEINRSEFFVMFLDELFGGNVLCPFGQRSNSLGKRRHTKHGTNALERGAAGEAIGFLRISGDVVHRVK